MWFRLCSWKSSREKTVCCISWGTVFLSCSLYHSGRKFVLFLLENLFWLVRAEIQDQKFYSLFLKDFCRITWVLCQSISWIYRAARWFIRFFCRFINFSENHCPCESISWIYRATLSFIRFLCIFINSNVKCCMCECIRRIYRATRCLIRLCIYSLIVVEIVTFQSISQAYRATSLLIRFLCRFVSLSWNSGLRCFI